MGGAWDEDAPSESLQLNGMQHLVCLPEREFFIDNLLVRIHFIIVMIRWTGLALWDFEFPFPGSLPSTFSGASGVRPTLLWGSRPLRDQICAA